MKRWLQDRGEDIRLWAGWPYIATAFAWLTTLGVMLIFLYKAIDAMGRSSWNEATFFVVCLLVLVLTADRSDDRKKGKLMQTWDGERWRS